jgi:hypothetical protein
MIGCKKQTAMPVPHVTVIVVTATPEPTFTPIPTLAPIIRATAAADIEARFGIPTPTTRPGYPTPVIPPWDDSMSESQTSVSLPELYIGKYVIRKWRLNPDVYRYTISSIGQPNIQTAPFVETYNAGHWSGLDPLTGIDITGEGNPDVIIHEFTGGMHCCHIAYVYDLGQTARMLFELNTADCPGDFLDLDNDGIYEYKTCDPNFQYAPLTSTGFSCSHASAPYPISIFKYSPEQGYQSANLQFTHWYAESIESHKKILDEYLQNPSSAKSSVFSICDVSKLVLDYLYSGQTEKAWETLYQVYPSEMADQYKAKIMTGLENNIFYDAP